MKASEEEQFSYDSVPELEEELRRLEDEIKAGTKGNTKAAIAFGETFLKAKKLLAHGMFLNWCDAKTNYSERYVQQYMNLAKLNRGLSHSDQEALCHLCPSAACKLAEPGVDKSDVEEILSRAMNERLKVKFVEEFLGRKKSETKSETKTETTESAADEAAPDSESSVATFLQALEPAQRESLWQSLRGKPKSQDQRFMKNLRSLLDNEFGNKPR